MANPLRLFRRYQYMFLVVFGIMLMFAFVIAPPLSDYLDTRVGMGQGANPVVVSWKSGEIRETDLSRMRSQQLLSVRFLQSLVQRVEALEDAPAERLGERIYLKKGRVYPLVGSGTNEQDEPIYQIVVGGEVVEIPQAAARRVFPKVDVITESPNEEELVQRVVLAEKAREMGLFISDQAIDDYLDNLSDASDLTRPDYAAQLRDATGGRLDMRQFRAHMAMELAAQRMLIMSHSGLFATTPDMLYAYYNKLNRRVIADLLAVDVASFVDQVEDPSEGELQTLYEEAKDRFASPTSPEPGFKRRKRIAFGFLAGTFDDFLQREMDAIRPTITDEEIQQYYDERRETDYKITELPVDPDDQTRDDLPPPESADETPPSDDSAAEPPVTEPPATEPPATEPPVTEPPVTEPPVTEPPVTEPPGSEPPPTDGGELLSATSREPMRAADFTPDVDNMVGRNMFGWQFVSVTQDEAPPSTPETPAAQDPPPTPDTPPAQEPPAAQDPPPTPETPPAQDTPAAQDPPAPDTSPTPETPVPQDPPPADEQVTASEEPAAESQEVESPPGEAKYKPLDDTLRNEIREILARRAAAEPAQKKLESAVEQAKSVVERYAQQLTQSQLLEGRERPAPLDFDAIAAEHQLTYQQTPLIDQVDIGQIQRMEPEDGDPPYYEFVRATETFFGQQTGMIRRTIMDVGFAGDVDLFKPGRLVDGMLSQGGFQIPPERLFVYWRREVVPEQVPPLEEIRDEVVRAWKLRKALPLAQDRAAEMARRATEADQPLVEVFPESASSVIRTMEFSWMTRGAMPGSMGGRPMLSPVNGIADGQPVSLSGLGDDFMRAVFDLEVGQVKTAVDQPQAFVYVVKIVHEQLTDEQRREQFFTSGYTPDINTLVQMDQADLIRDWFDRVEQELDLDWKREPVAISRFE